MRAGETSACATSSQTHRAQTQGRRSGEVVESSEASGAEAVVEVAGVERLRIEHPPTLWSFSPCSGWVGVLLR